MESWKIITNFVLISFFMACGTVDIQQHSKIMERLDGPECEKRSGSFFCNGIAANKKDCPEAIESAKNQALINMRQHFSVDLAFEFRDHTLIVTKNGSQSYNRRLENEDVIMANAITIKGIQVTGKQCESLQSGKVNASLYVGISESEYDRIIEAQERAKNALTAWTLESDFREECGVEKIKNLFSFFKEKMGLNIVEQEETSARSAEEIARQHPDYAYFLKIECNKAGENYDPYNKNIKFYYVNLNVELYDLTEGINKKWFQPQVKGGKVKVGDFWRYGTSSNGGASDAVLKAIEIIKDQIN